MLLPKEGTLSTHKFLNARSRIISHQRTKKQKTVETINDTYSALGGRFALMWREGRLQQNKKMCLCFSLVDFNLIFFCFEQTILRNAQVGAHVKAAHFVDGDRLRVE